MTDADKVIEDFLLKHAYDPADYDPAKAHEYYMRTRKLKGRPRATAQPGRALNSHSPLSTVKTKKPKRVEEDQVPMKSPKGAKLVDYIGKGAGHAIYSDGSVFDGNGWHKPTRNARLTVTAAKLQLAMRRAQNNKEQKRRLDDIQKRFNRLAENKMPNSAPKPPKNAADRQQAVEDRLNAAHEKAKKLPPHQRKHAHKKIDELRKKLHNPFHKKTKVNNGAPFQFSPQAMNPTFGRRGGNSRD